MRVILFNFFTVFVKVIIVANGSETNISSKHDKWVTANVNKSPQRVYLVRVVKFGLDLDFFSIVHTM